MKGSDLIAALEREGFAISRRSKTLVWLARGGDRLMVDADAEVEDDVAEEILAKARTRSDSP